MKKRTFIGKFEQINGHWYPLSVRAYSIKDAIKSTYKGKMKPYGVVQNIKGRFKEDVD